jgi:MFS family permease
MLAAAFAFEALGGMGNAADNVTSDTLIQRTVPARMMGRVFGLRGSAAFVSSAIAYAIGGPLLDAVSARTVFVIAGAGVVGVGVLAFVLMPRTAGREILDPG